MQAVIQKLLIKNQGLLEKVKTKLRDEGKKSVLKYKSKLPTPDTLKDKFTRLNFYEGGNEGSVEPSKKSDISKRLESLTSLYEKGLLTETEFKKAKEKLLK